MPISPTWRTDRYDVNSANTNRQVRFLVEAQATAKANTFTALKGPANHYPHYHQIQGATDAQELGQIRLSLVVRAMSQYAIPVAIEVFDNGVASASGSGSSAYVVYEQDEMGVFFNNNWPVDATKDKHAPDGTDGVGTTDWITDTVGTGGMPNGPKEKKGLNLLLDELATVSFDGGTTGPFGALSAGASIVLPDGVSVATGASAPTLPVAGGRLSGLEVTWVGY